MAIVLLHVIVVPRAVGEFYSLPAWFFYGGAVSGTWDGSSTSPDNAQLTVSLSPPIPPMPGQYATAVGTCSADILQIAPGTTYNYTLSAMVAGSAACEALTVDSAGVIAHTLISGSTWKRYTNSFTTAGPDDPRVGRFLNVQLLLMKSSGNFGTANGFFTNLQVEAVAQRPSLAIQALGAGQAELRWPTNYYWYVPEHSTNLVGDAWESIPDSLYIESNQFVLPVSTQPESRFFRLRQP